jgi:hypothetical protein
MKNAFLLSVLSPLLLSGLAPAAALSGIPRILLKEPRYQSTPRYCLLVFGLEPRTRIWLVLDEDVLYADLNGNGDLTEPAERFRLPAFVANQGHSVYAASRGISLGSIQAETLRHEKLWLEQYRIQPGFVPKNKHQQHLKELLARNPNISEFRIDVSIEWRPRPGDRVPIHGRVEQWAGTDASGWLQFAERARDAPIIHFAGPLSMGLAEHHEEEMSGIPRREARLTATVGTPGLGKGTFAEIDFNGLLYEDNQPQAEISFPARGPGAKAIVRRTVLKFRAGRIFDALVEIPKEARPGAAEVRLSLPDADIAVAPARVRLPVD